MSDKLPKVSIAVVGVVIAQIGGFIWWTAQQASTISNLEETVNVLTVENNATDRTNLIRDVEANSEQLDEMIDILVEVYEDMEDGDNEIWEDIDQIHEDVGGMASHMMAIVKLQSRVKTLENTLEFLTRRPTMSDGR
jgi:ATPase subunit of ABC transporter with duplicated ATPase domains